MLQVETVADMSTVGDTAAMWAALTFEPMVAKSVAADVIISGAAITTDIPTSNQYSDGPTPPHQQMRQIVPNSGRLRVNGATSRPSTRSCGYSPAWLSGNQIALTRLVRKSEGEWAGRRHPAEPGIALWVWGQAAVSVITALPSRMTMCWSVSACSWMARSRARRCLLMRDS